jgi:hypothetical protein
MRRRRRHGEKNRAPAIAVALAVLALSASPVVILSKLRAAIAAGANRNRIVAFAPRAVSAIRATRTPLIFAFSVIPGGVFSPDELTAAISGDPTVAAHYADFRTGSFRLIRNSIRRSAYVSYRKNGHIYWTSHMVSIPVGETLISDGRSLARSRCGNRISAVPQEPTAPGEPREPDLDQFLTSPPADQPGEEPGVVGTPSASPWYAATFGPSGAPPLATPEPAMWPALAIIFAVGARRLRRKGRR